MAILPVNISGWYSSNTIVRMAEAKIKYGKNTKHGISQLIILGTYCSEFHSNRSPLRLLLTPCFVEVFCVMVTL